MKKRWYLYLCIAVIFYVVGASIFVWTPKAKKEAAENITVRAACFSLANKAKAYQVETGCYPRCLGDVIVPLLAAVQDTSFNYDPYSQRLSHGLFSVEYVPVKDELGNIVDFNVNMTDPHLETTTVCTSFPGEEGG